MEEKKTIKSWQLILAIILTVVVTSIGTLFLYYNYLVGKGVLISSNNANSGFVDTIKSTVSDVFVSGYDENATLEEKLNVIRSILEKYYLYSDEIDGTDLIDSALKGYVAGLGDEYTELMTNAEYESFAETMSDYVGIGIYVAETTSGETVIIGAVGNDSPAYEAGIETGDVIVKVDGVDVTELELDDVVSKVKGEEGTTVKVTVERDDEELEFEVERKDIKVYEITYKMVSDDIGYIDFDQFTEEAADEFKTAYEKLKKSGAEKLIIDLRNNTGGYVSTAEDILDLFLDEGEIEYITVDNNGNETTTISQNGKTIDMPVVILTNEYTASASEILTGCLKDLGIATVVGTTTYGKGVIQNVIPILNGAAYLKVTTMKYVTPNKNEINEVGITPDKEIELEDETKDGELDNQIKEAIKILE